MAIRIGAGTIRLEKPVASILYGLVLVIFGLA